jgi:hypothetical protein
MCTGHHIQKRSIMPGRGPAPKPNRRRSNTPERGEYTAVPSIGWRFGTVPSAPPKLLKASQDAWTVWMGAWFAAHWTPDDLPALRQLVRLYDQVERGEYQRSTELRLAMDTYGITPKGQQDRRWVPPEPDAKPAEKPASGYRNLRVVGE